MTSQSLKSIAFAGTSAMWSLLPQTTLADQKPPNIIFILADDLGYTDTSAYGSRYYETPNIEKLAADGLKFTNGYSNGPNCQPTRAARISASAPAATEPILHPYCDIPEPTPS